MRSRPLFSAFALVTTLLLAAPALAAPTSTEAVSAASPEQTARDAFHALRAGEAKRYDALVPTAARLVTLMKTHIATLPADQREAVTKKMVRNGDLDTLFTASRAKALARFAQARKASAKDFDWTTARFAGVDYSRLRGRLEGVVKTGEIWFFVRAGNTLHEFGAPDALLVDDQWTFVEGLTYVGAVGTSNRLASDEAQRANHDLHSKVAKQNMTIQQLRRQLDHVTRSQTQAGTRSDGEHAEMRTYIAKLERERRELTDRHEEATHRHEEMLADVQSRARDQVADAQFKLDMANTNLARAKVQVEREQGTRKALERRMADLRDRVDTLAFGQKAMIKGLAPLILKALSHESESVRRAAEYAAQDGQLIAARPHFMTVVKDQTADPFRRIRAARFLAKTGAARELAPILVAMWKNGIAKSVPTDDVEPLKAALRDVLVLAGVNPDELKRSDATDDE